MSKSYACFAVFLLSTALVSELWAQQDPGGPARISRQDSITIDYVATIMAIDRETREIQLKDAQGNVRQVTAGPRIKRFDDLAVGDRVNASIEITARAEVRAPTEEELASLDSIRRGTVRTPDDGPIAGSMAESGTSVVTVVGLNLLTQVVTVLNAEGNLVDVRAEHEENLKQLRLGDDIVITYTASMAVSVVPVESPAVE